MNTERYDWLQESHGLLPISVPVGMRDFTLEQESLGSSPEAVSG